MVVSTCAFPESPWRDRIVFRRAFRSMRWAYVWVRLAAVWADIFRVPHAAGHIGVDWCVVEDPRGELMCWPMWEPLTRNALLEASRHN